MKRKREKNWLSDRLAFLNKRKNVLAKVLGMHAQHVNRLLLKIKLTPTQFEQLASFLECDYLQLLRFWENKITAEELFSAPPNKVAVGLTDLTDLAFILDQIEAWLAHHRKKTATLHKLELALALYEATRETPVEERSAQIIRMLDFQTRMKAM